MENTVQTDGTTGRFRKVSPAISRNNDNGDSQMEVNDGESEESW